MIFSGPLFQRLPLAIVAGATLAVLPPCLHAQRTWSSTNPNGDWNDASKWTGGLPGTGVSINIQNNGASNPGAGEILLSNYTANTGGNGYTINIGNASESGKVHVGAGGIWNIDQSTLTVGRDSGRTGILDIANGGKVNSTGTGTVFTYIGWGSTAVGGTRPAGSLLIDGVGSEYNQAHSFWVGYRMADGSLTVSNGGKLSTVYTTLGYLSAYSGGVWYRGNATVTIEGAGSTWTATNFFNIGREGGSAAIEVKAGGKVTGTGATYLGHSGRGEAGGSWNQGLSSLTVTGSGSEWTSGLDLFVGTTGAKAELTISNQGKASGGNGGVHIGNSGSTYNSVWRPADGTVTVTGAGSELTSTYALNVGISGGKGTLNVLDGGKITTVSSSVGGFSTGVAANGTALVDGAASVWNNTSAMIVGDTGGQGTITIRNGGRVNSSTWSSVGYGSLDNGTQKGNGTALIDGAGSAWVSNYSFGVGEYGGTGTVTVQNGGKIQSAVLYIGTAATTASVHSNGTLNLYGVAGNRGLLQTGFLSKGRGTARININGGLIRATSNTEFTQTYLQVGFVLGDIVLGDGGLMDGSNLIGDGGLYLDTQTYFIGWAAPISGAGNLTKQGSGYLNLSGTNTYTGQTRVEAGRLSVTGSIAASSLTTINAGATLEGNGSVGDLDLHGKLSPGANPPGAMVTGDAVWNDGASLRFEIVNFGGVAGTGWDLLDVQGTLTLDVDPGQYFTIDLFTLKPLEGAEMFYNPGLAGNFNGNLAYHLVMARTTGGVLGFSASDFIINATGISNVDPGAWSVSSDGMNLILNYTPVPEPSLAALLALAGGAASLARRRRSCRG